MDMPMVVMDEAGHTGENLLDSDQPVYALAAVQMDEATARAVGWLTALSLAGYLWARAAYERR